MKTPQPQYGNLTTTEAQKLIEESVSGTKVITQWIDASRNPEDFRNKEFEIFRQAMWKRCQKRSKLICKENGLDLEVDNHFYKAVPKLPIIPKPPKRMWKINLMVGRNVDVSIPFLSRRNGSELSTLTRELVKTLDTTGNYNPEIHTFDLEFVSNPVDFDEERRD